MLFARQWPDWMRRWLPYYWYFALLYSLPFFFSFMLLKNNGADVWIGSALVAVFVMILLLDWVTLIGQFLLGSGLAYLAFSLTGDGNLPAFERWDYVAIAGFAVVAGAVTNYDAERIRIEQERAMLATAGSIAHELRTPLLGIRAGAAGLSNYLPTLIDAYQLAQSHGLPVEPIRTAHLDSLRGVLERIDSEARQSNAIIDMMLVNARVGRRDQAGIAALLDGHLRRNRAAPLPVLRRRATPGFLGQGRRFPFRGVELLMVHVLFNLIKNALRHIAHAGKGEIRIAHRSRRPPSPDRARQRRRHSERRAAAHLRALLYLHRHDDSVLGAGIGLAFCRDVMTCLRRHHQLQSVHGEYTRIRTQFPCRMNNYAIQPFHFPTTVAFIDDSLQFLSNLSLQLDSRLAYRLYSSPFAALVALNGASARMPPVAERFFSLYRHRNDKKRDAPRDRRQPGHDPPRSAQRTSIRAGIGGGGRLRHAGNRRAGVLPQPEEQGAEEDPAHRQGRRTDRRARLQREDHRSLHPQAGRRRHVAAESRDRRIATEHFDQIEHMLADALAVGSHLFLRDPAFAERFAEIRAA
jgi:signal transduction histidine kinase